MSALGDYIVYNWRPQQEVKMVRRFDTEKEGIDFINQEINVWLNQGLKPCNYKLCYNGILNTPDLYRREF